MHVRWFVTCCLPHSMFTLISCAFVSSVLAINPDFAPVSYLLPSFVYAGYACRSIGTFPVVLLIVLLVYILLPAERHQMVHESIDIYNRFVQRYIDYVFLSGTKVNSSHCVGYSLFCPVILFIISMIDVGFFYFQKKPSFSPYVMFNI